MKFILTSVLIASVFGITVLSFVEMASDSHGGRCIADFLAKTQGGFCPGESATLSYISFHFNTVKSFGAAVFGNTSILLLFIFAFSAFLTIAIVYKIIRVFSARVSEYVDRSFISMRAFVRWLSLCEHSPSLSV